MMRYYNNYLDKIATPPSITYKSFAEAFVHSQWEDSNLLSMVEQETANGTFVFHPIEVWKNNVTQFQSQIIKNDRDFKRLMFKHNHVHVERGRYYKFEDNHQKNYWIVYEGTNEEEPYTDVLVRRCNNILKWIDKKTGKLYEFPCVLEYNLSATNPKVDKDVITANTSTTLVVQGNEITHTLKKNQRFIFNGQPFKFVAYNNWMQNNYVNKDVTLLFIDIDLDIEKPTDNIEENIADFEEYQYEVKIDNAPTQGVAYSQGQLIANVLFEGEYVDNVVEWSGNEFVEVSSDGTYILGDSGNTAIITANFGHFSSSVEIEIVDVVTEHKQIVIYPMFESLNQLQSQTFEVALYVDGIKQDMFIDVVTSGAKTECYDLQRSGNVFTLTNMNISLTPLHLVFECDGENKEMDVMLKAMF